MKKVYEAEQECKDGKFFKKVDKSKATHVVHCRCDEGIPCKRMTIEEDEQKRMTIEEDEQ